KVTAPDLAHVWQKPGRYPVTVTSDGNQEAFFVEVKPRAVLDVIPSAAKLALIVPQPWKLLPRVRALMDRMGLPVELRRRLSQLAEKSGAGGSEAALIEHGIDPQEGLALIVMPEDHEAWLLL